MESWRLVFHKHNVHETNVKVKEGFITPRGLSSFQAVRHSKIGQKIIIAPNFQVAVKLKPIGVSSPGSDCVVPSYSDYYSCLSQVETIQC